jgi:hypothetical protein
MTILGVDVTTRGDVAGVDHFGDAALEGDLLPHVAEGSVAAPWRPWRLLVLEAISTKEPG